MLFASKVGEIIKNWNNPTRKNINPLETPVERAACEIVKILNKSGNDSYEVLEQAIAWYAPDFHIHANPRKKGAKKDTSYEDTMDMASKYIEKYKGY